MLLIAVAGALAISDAGDTDNDWTGFAAAAIFGVAVALTIWLVDAAFQRVASGGLSNRVAGIGILISCAAIPFAASWDQAFYLWGGAIGLLLGIGILYPRHAS